MKKTIVFNFFILAFVFTKCDKIKHPDQRPPKVYHCIDTLFQVVKTNTATSNFRKVLLEDYTGHHCQNCPRAAEAAESLTAQYGNKLVVIANHVSIDFAQPNRDPNGTICKEDFRNDASTAWDDKNSPGMGFSNAGLPQGTVNRIGIPNFPQVHTKWPGLVNTAISKPQVARLDVTTYYDTVNHYLSTKVKTTFKTPLTNNVNLIIVLTQDSIRGCQKDGKPPAGSVMSTEDASYRTNYRFDNIVIESINGTWGQLVKAAPIAINDTLTLSTSCFLLNKCFETTPFKACVNDNYVNLIAFIYDVTTYEVLQVEKLKIK